VLDVNWTRPLARTLPHLDAHGTVRGYANIAYGQFFLCLRLSQMTCSVLYIVLRTQPSAVAIIGFRAATASANHLFTLRNPAGEAALQCLAAPCNVKTEASQGTHPQFATGSPAPRRIVTMNPNASSSIPDSPSKRLSRTKSRLLYRGHIWWRSRPGQTSSTGGCPIAFGLDTNPVERTNAIALLHYSARPLADIGRVRRRDSSGFQSLRCPSHGGLTGTRHGAAQQ
jgi:hypothetical protein